MQDSEDKLYSQLYSKWVPYVPSLALFFVLCCVFCLIFCCGSSSTYLQTHWKAWFSMCNGVWSHHPWHQGLRDKNEQYRSLVNWLESGGCLWNLPSTPLCTLSPCLCWFLHLPESVLWCKFFLLSMLLSDLTIHSFFLSLFFGIQKLYFSSEFWNLHKS